MTMILFQFFMLYKLIYRCFDRFLMCVVNVTKY